MAEHKTAIADEGTLVNANAADPVAEANALHHLATADPEPERGDGTLTGPAHEAKYGLERAPASARLLAAQGVDPLSNGALIADPVETADVPAPVETASAPRATRK